MGGVLSFSNGTYNIAASMGYAKSNTLVTGYGAEFKKMSSIAEIFAVSSCSRVTFRGFKINGNGNRYSGLRIAGGGSNTSDILVDDIEVTGLNYTSYDGGCIKITPSGATTIKRVWVRNLYVHDCTGAAGVLASGASSYIYVTDSIFDTVVKAVVFDTGLDYGVIARNLSIYDSGIVHLEDATNVDVFDNTGLNSTQTGVTGMGAPGVGILADGDSDRHRIYRNTILNAGDDGIQTASEGETGFNYVKSAAGDGYSISPHGHPYSMTGDTAVSCAGGGFMFHPSGDNLVYKGLRAIDNTNWGIRSDTCDDSTFVNPYSTGSTHGFYSANGGLRTNIMGGYLGGNVNAITLASGSTLNRVRNVLGYVTENSGTSSITSGQTTKVVAHGLATTPTRIDINFREQGTSDYGRWWVDTIGATNFTLNVSADPGASNLDFAWRAEVY